MYTKVLKKLVLGFFSFHYDMALGFASASYLVDFDSREATYT